jgi:hypothetical protein
MVVSVHLGGSRLGAAPLAQLHVAALNGASTALNGLASLQATGEVAGQRLAERPFTRALY